MRRYRFPYIAFKEILLPLVKSHNIFNMRRSSYVPVEFKLLIALRMLGRGSVADDMSEMSKVSASTCYSIFHTFIESFSTSFFDTYVSMPSGSRLDAVRRAYERMGMSGCVGSMDCTHIWWDHCPIYLTNLCKGKVGVTTLSFQCIVAPNREILHCSEGFPGSFNDKNVAHMDNFCKEIMLGKFNDIEYILFDENGVPRKCKGGYLIVDGGYQKLSCFVCPDKHCLSHEQTLYSEFLESVRKDVECSFGILKAR